MQLYDGRGSQEVELPKMNLSPVYKLRSGPVELHLLEKAPASKRDVPADAPHVAVTEEMKDFILLVAQKSEKIDADVQANESGNAQSDESAEAGDGGKILTLMLIEVDPRKFKPGGLLWVNLTENRIKGTLGDEEFTLDAGSQTVVSDPIKGGGSFPVKLSFSIPGDDQLRPLSETKWIHYPKGRIVQFVMEEQGSVVPRLLGVADNR
ncbi:hypothetical protein [Haloferula sp.]|uniref:hypothetical protein n=1 Tax=Haloferula sp. TaxID=2497595 RepID=UPI003C74DDEA